MKIAIIGTGDITQKAYFPLLRTMEHVEIASVTSRTQASVDKAQKRWQIPSGFTGVQDVIKSKPDAAMVLNATVAHFQTAKALLENGIDVYIEKPATVSSAETLALAELAQAQGLVLMVGFNRRYADFYVQARELIPLSEIMQITLEKHRRNASHLNLYSQYLDDTIHQIDLLRSFDPDPVPLQTLTTMREGRLRSAVSLLRLSNGGLATIHSCLDSGAWQEKVSIHGGKKSLHVNGFRDLTYIDDNGIRLFGPERPGKWKSELVERGFYAEVRHFMDCVQTRAKPKTDGFEAYKTQLLVEQLSQLAGEPLEYHEFIRDGK